MAGRGGRRAGAGAPTEAATTAKAAAAKTAAARFQERAEQDFDRIYDALSDLALGVWVEDEEKGRVYRRPPDRGALQTMMEHLKGRAAITPAALADTSITFVAAHVPRPRKEGVDGVETAAAGPADLCAAGDQGDGVDAAGMEGLVPAGGEGAG